MISLLAHSLAAMAALEFANPFDINYSRFYDITCERLRETERLYMSLPASSSNGCLHVTG